MAEANGQEKTEQASPKRRKDARKEGNVFQSKDVATVVTLFGMFTMLQWMIPAIHENVRQFLMQILSEIGRDPVTVATPQLFATFISAFFRSSLILLLSAMALGILAYGIQTKFLISFQRMKPKLSKLSPLKGIKRMFSMKNLVELVKNIAKAILLIVLLYSTLQGDLASVVKMIDMQSDASASYMFDMIFQLVRNVSLAFAVIGFFDFMYQRWSYEKDLKMTKQEVKEEFKQMEGNPEIKGRIKSIQRQMAMSRMMQKVPESDVIIRNPTHFAIALKYDPEKNGAPVVLAKGQDALALRIVKVGEENGVFITENRPLARALYDTCEIGREIPVEFYGAIAEILVYIYKASHREEMFK